MNLMNTKWLIIIIGMLIIGSGAYFFLSSFDRSLNAIEESAAVAFSIQSDIDAILAGKTLPSDARVSLIATAYAAEGDSERLLDLGNRSQKQWSIIKGKNVPPALVGFRSAIEGWLFDMWQAAEKMGATRSETERRSIWRAVPDEPPPFSMDLPEDEIIRIMETKIKEIIHLKEAGDAAIETNNRQGMLQVAAALRVQKYYLDYHLFQKKGVCPQVGLCYPELTRTLLPFTIAAGGYAYGEPDAAARWTKTWQANELVIGAGGSPIAGTDVLTGTGITIGAPDTFKFGRSAKAFFDLCTDKGGILGGTGGIKEGLPTTEAGYTCWHDTNKQCWDFLTYSGDFFEGGGSQCINIPVVTASPTPVPTVAPTPPPAPVSVTGTGTFRGGSFGSVRLNFNPGGGLLSGTANAPGGTVIINGSVNASGHLTGGLSGTLSETFSGQTFSCSVTGTMSGDITGRSASGDYSGSCGEDSESGTWSVSW